MKPGAKNVLVPSACKEDVLLASQIEASEIDKLPRPEGD